MSGGRIIESGPGRDLLLAPKTEEAARFFGAGQVLPCKILEKHEEGIEVSTPLGNLIVPHNPDSEYNPGTSMLFIPEDAIFIEVADAKASDTARLKPFSARFTGSLFEGKGLVLKLLLNPWENPGETQSSPPEPLPFEVTAGKRMKAPESGSVINLLVDQSLLRFVK
jgi:ABC-type Fe3+/spermidine/putrescine transport system ATPase subunit